MAATIYWDGTGTSWASAASWSTASNATTPNPAAPPGASDIAIFNTTTVNALQLVKLDAAQSVLGLVFQSGSVGTSIQSGAGTNALSIGADGITFNSFAGDEIIAPVSLTANQSWTNNSTGVALSVDGNISNGSNQLTISGSGLTALAGILGGGSGGLTKTGTGSLFLDGANTYTGSTTISSGTVVLNNANALGSTVGGTTVGSGATLDLNGRSVGTEPLTISGAGVGGNGALVNSSTTSPTLTGTITNQSFTVGGNGVINLSGSINGSGTITKIGTGSLILSGTTDNNGLSLAVNAGDVVLAKTSSHSPDVHAVGANPPLFGMVVDGGTAQLGGTGDDQIFDSATVTVTSGAFDTFGHNETIASLKLQGSGIGGTGRWSIRAGTASRISQSPAAPF